LQRFRKDRIAQTTEPKQLQKSVAPSERGVRAALATAAVLLVFSSAGFGCVFAYQQAAHHGPALAGLAVAMALGLELAKPFAVESVFACLRRLAIVRALSMALLAAVAIGYSLTAELTLMAQNRGDRAAEREAAGDARQMAKDRHRRAAAELATIGPTRPAGELQALLGGKGCGEPDNARTRTLCAELGRATRRQDLEAALSRAEADSVTRKAVAAPDAGAASLSALLAVLGWTVTPGALVPWLVLVGVVALEAGSTLAVVLCRSAPLVPRIVTHNANQPAGSVTPPTPSRKRGRPPLGERAMTSAERQRRYRESASAANGVAERVGNDVVLHS
jgi:hypothetical protein